jgi:DNA-binding IclR family transcriptional regulator
VQDPGAVLLAELSDEQLESLFSPERYAERPGDRPDLAALRRDLSRVRGQGFAVNEGRSERGVVAVGCPIRRPDGSALAGLSVSMPSGRYDPRQLRTLVATLTLIARAIETDLASAG